MTGDDLRAAIREACELINPRLSEVDWEAVAAALRATPVADTAGIDAARGTHEPGDFHDYNRPIECAVCGQRGHVQVSIEPQRAAAPVADSETFDGS